MFDTIHNENGKHENCYRSCHDYKESKTGGTVWCRKCGTIINLKTGNLTAPSHQYDECADKLKQNIDWKKIGVKK